MMMANQHIQIIVNVLKNHTENVEYVILESLRKASEIAKDLNVGLTLYHIVDRQKHRSNSPVENPSEYWRCLIIPYLDAIISPLEVRFSTDNSSAFLLLSQ